MFNFKKFIPQRHGYTIFERKFWKMWCDRRTKGFDETETWSLDYTITKFIAPRLKEFIKYGPKMSFPQPFLDIEYKKALKKGFKWDKQLNRLTNNRECNRCLERAAKAWENVLEHMLAGFEDEVLEEKDWDKWTKKWQPVVDKYNKRLEKAKTEAERKSIWDELGNYNYNRTRNVVTEDVVYKMRQLSKDLLAHYYNDLWW